MLSNLVKIIGRAVLPPALGLLVNSTAEGAFYWENDTAVAKTDTVENADTLHISRDAVKSRIKYTAKDSIRFDVIAQKVYLYGDAKVNYENIALKAAYIEVDWQAHTVYAEGREDSTGKMSGLPEFADGPQSFRAHSMRYNIDTKKGKITYVTTQEGDGFIKGRTVKKDEDNNFYVKNGLYTTCNADTPHYYLGAGKLKVIQNDKIVTGPAYLVVENVPTPLAIPFGFFPNKRGQTSGILIPTYGESASLGFFLRNGGYYWGINDHLDMALRGDIYSKGSWGANLASNYALRYRYNGNLSVRYSRILTGERELPGFALNKDFFVRWNHMQDPKARPNSRFSASVNAGTSSYFRNNISVGSDYLSNTFQSTVSYSTGFNFIGAGFNLSMSGRHTQNTFTRDMDISLPDISLGMNRAYPFKRKSRVGEMKWYEKIGVSYSSVAINQITAKDTDIFKSATLDKMRNGMRHTIPVSTSFQALKYFSVTPSLNMSSRWYLRTIRRRFDEDLKQVVTDTVNGFRAAQDFSVATSASTRLYGMFLFNKGAVRAVRHVLTPVVSVSYHPDFGKRFWGAYEEIKKDTTGATYRYSYFEQGIYGGPPLGEAGVLSLSFDNNLEMKVRSRKDTVTGVKKVKLIDGLNIGSSYNVAADSLNWSHIFMNGRATLFNRLNLNFNASYDPYILDAAGLRRNQLEWDVNRRPGRLVNAGLAAGINLNRRAGQPKASTKGTEQELRAINMNPDAFVDFNIPWNLSINYNINYSKPGIVGPVTTQSLNFNGDVNITPKWKIGFNSGYDFVNKDFTYTSINIYRDLHCWEMSLNWIPFGAQQSYNFQINVKSAVLQDLKLVRRRDWYDN